MVEFKSLQWGKVWQIILIILTLGILSAAATASDDHWYTAASLQSQQQSQCNRADVLSTGNNQCTTAVSLPSSTQITTQKTNVVVSLFVAFTISIAILLLYRIIHDRRTKPYPHFSWSTLLVFLIFLGATRSLLFELGSPGYVMTLMRIIAVSIPNSPLVLVPTVLGLIIYGATIKVAINKLRQIMHLRVHNKRETTRSPFKFDVESMQRVFMIGLIITVTAYIFGGNWTLPVTWLCGQSSVAVNTYSCMQSPQLSTAVAVNWANSIVLFGHLILVAAGVMLLVLNARDNKSSRNFLYAHRSFSLKNLHKLVSKNTLMNILFAGTLGIIVIYIAQNIFNFPSCVVNAASALRTTCVADSAGFSAPRLITAIKIVSYSLFIYALLVGSIRTLFVIVSRYGKKGLPRTPLSHIIQPRLVVAAILLTILGLVAAIFDYSSKAKDNYTNFEYQQMKLTVDAIARSQQPEYRPYNYKYANENCNETGSGQSGHRECTYQFQYAMPVRSQAGIDQLIDEFPRSVKYLSAIEKVVLPTDKYPALSSPSPRNDVINQDTARRMVITLSDIRSTRCNILYDYQMKDMNSPITADLENGPRVLFVYVCKVSVELP